MLNQHQQVTGLIGDYTMKEAHISTIDNVIISLGFDQFLNPTVILSVINRTARAGNASFVFCLPRRE